MFKFLSRQYIKISVVVIIALGFVFAFAYFFYSNSTKSKASYTNCISGRVCKSNAQCGQSGKCVFTDPTIIGRCVCFTIIPTKEPTPTVQVPTPIPSPSYGPTPSYSPIPSPTPVLPEYYIKTSEWINASPNVASTIIFGCNPGDIAVGGGMDDYTGPINIWRTVRSGPTNSAGQNSWQTTVINESSSTYQYTVTAKCLKLVK